MFRTPWMSRLAAVLLLIVVIEAAYSLVAEPILIGYREANKAIEEGREQLSHFQRLAAGRPVLGKLLERLAADQGSETYYLSGGTDALAAVALQDRVRDLVDANGGNLRSMQPLLGVDEQGFRRITVRVEMTATIEPLFETLYALETGMPVLFVENLDIQSRSTRRRSSQVAMQVAADDAPLLTVGFDLSGYMPVERE
ncbi:MAG TPA: type II secretion system protein GspM [Dongiaceae bacterium]|jgi:general secretion pathway protein M|nr:type II secretion system protein GspM [Dongiaceae bacterium]